MLDQLSTLLTSVPWPFPVRPTLENLADPEVRRLIGLALSELGLAVLLLTIALVVRRGRFVPVLFALPLIIMQGPSLSYLLVDATPASYRPSPTGFSAAAIASGRSVFVKFCVACHGNAADGVGGLGPLADLRQQHLWEHPVGDLFWFVSHGVTPPDGSTPAMPAFETILSERARWSAIDYVYALNAGSVTRGLDGWPHRVPAPAVPLTCAASEANAIPDLRGKVVRVILGTPPVPFAAVPPVNGIDVVTVWIPGPETEATPIKGIDCVAGSVADSAEAYAILAGSADGQVVPARFLIDPDGVLRSVWREGDGDAWIDPVRLLEEVREICAEPLTIEPGGDHEHHH